MATARVYLTQELLADYRRELFHELGGQEFHMTYLSGASGPDGLVTLASDEINTVQLLNHRIGPFLWQKGLIATVYRDKPDVLVLSGDYSHLSSWIAAIYRRVVGRPVLFWTMGWRTEERGVKKMIRLMFYGLSHALLLYGENAEKIGRQMRFKRPMHVVGNSLPSPPVVHHRRSLRRSIGFVSRLTPARETDVLLNAAASMKSPIHLVIAGDGPELVRLRALANSLHLSVDWQGAVRDPAAIADIYAQMDLCVIPGAAGLAVIQSLQHGVPVLAHDDDSVHGPEVGAITTGITGDRFRRGDADDLADRISAWVERTERQKQETAVRCRASAEQAWSTSAHVSRMRDAILLYVPVGRGR